MSTKRKINYLMLKIQGQIVKIDPDIYDKIRNPGHEIPDKKYNGDIATMRIDNGYPTIIFASNSPRRRMNLSKFIMNPKKGQVVDHINRDKLYNRRCNLRIATPRQNALNRKNKNSSGYLGVRINTRKYKYCQARYTTIDGKNLSIQFPDTPHNRIIAAFARDKFVLQQGEEKYALMNFPCWRFEPFRSYLLQTDLRKWAEKRLAPSPVDGGSQPIKY